MEFRNQFMRSLGFFLIFGMVVFVGVAVAGQNSGKGGNGNQMGLASIISSLPYEALSEAEINGLTHMREEEKLARDVYTTLYEKWGSAIFSNIARSEQQHMTAVKLLLDKYGVPDPVEDSSVGEFTSQEMANLYVQLTEQGSLSLVDALLVGATIEDLDIDDLYSLLDNVEIDNSDIRTVYQNLVKGSRNHLRAFNYQLSLNNATYEAQYLTQEQIDDILSSDWERGMVDEDGNPLVPANGRKGQGKAWD